MLQFGVKKRYLGNCYPYIDTLLPIYRHITIYRENMWQWCSCLSEPWEHHQSWLHPASPPCPWAQNSILADPTGTTGGPVLSPASSPAPWCPNHESIKKQKENNDQRSCLAVTEKEKLNQRSACWWLGVQYYLGQKVTSKIHYWYTRFLFLCFWKQHS